MNERIFELAEQAWLADSVEIDPNYKKYVGTERILKHLTGYNQKFAELIVKEVLAVQEKLIADGHNAWHLHSPTKEHFGVE